MKTEPMVRFQAVSKRYGPLTVLDGLDLDVARGEKVAIIGPSGSGKTTVLRMLMTLETIDDGVIFVDGRATYPYGEKRTSGAGQSCAYAPRALEDRHGISIFQSVSTYDCHAKLH